MANGDTGFQSSILLLSALIQDNSHLHAKIDTISKQMEDLHSLLRSQGQSLIGLTKGPQKSARPPKNKPASYARAASGGQPPRPRIKNHTDYAGHPVVAINALWARGHMWLQTNQDTAAKKWGR